MENLFLQYLRETSAKFTRHEDKIPHSKPVITISREYGCPGERIAEKLILTLIKKNHAAGGKDNWHWVSKEIIEESAQKLKITPSLMQELSKKSDEGLFDGFASFFADKFYPSDRKIQNTIASFIYTAAIKGNVVILGRASEIITRNFINALHIKLYAPLDWRTEVTSINESVSMGTAKRLCEDNDARREGFRHYFRGEKESSGFYDAMFNCKELNDDEIIEMVLILAETRGFV
ncbi:MAG: cytidylate kinase-like family protein [Breznakibacter sp.]